ncbi:MAG: von Willebrand factor type A domain-containing protein [Polaribacter sp.]|uniref:YfbK domain-containing protein n=1 Tax=Polaribacter sp. TaxID=1920175 RepID=UPI003BB16F03
MLKKLIFVWLIFGISIANSQEKNITGIVSDSSGALLGVSIIVKGTTNGTKSDFDGKYSITANLGDILVYRYLGFVTVEKTVETSSIINVLMLEDASVLDEIVIVGYGTTTKRSYTGSATSLIKTERSKSNYSNINQALKGEVAGVTVLQSSGSPGSNNSIIIRGYSSPNNNREPLYIVDGVPVNQNNNLAKYIDTKDIEKIDVLKGNNATSLYGNSAANGCIIITTKKGNYNIENDESYAEIKENQFKRVGLAPLSTFSIDVDKASYSNVRRMINNGEKIPVNAVKIEEMINYFDYNYPQPKDVHPFSINTEYVNTPWNNNTKLVRIGLQGKTFEQENLPASNLTFLIDVSGSMGSQNKLPLLKSAFKLLVNQLRKQDKVSIVVYAGAAGVVLKPTSGNEKETILKALNNLESGGSTAGGRGIELAYKLAEKNFKKNGNNRVILATDGDFNVGFSSDKKMEELIEEKRKSGVFLSVLGFGMGNYKDSKLEILADKGNGNHAYIDTMQEAQKVLGEEFGGTLHTIAKDVKIQIEFNPNKVEGYRLIGYENRLLEDEDFIDDTKDAGELGSGHKVTALYEIILKGDKNQFLKEVPELKYSNNDVNQLISDELFTVKFRYKKPSEDKSIEMIHTQKDVLETASEDLKFASAVALFGMKLRKSQYYKNIKNREIIELAENGRGKDENGYRAEFIRLVKSI